MRLIGHWRRYRAAAGPGLENSGGHLPGRVWQCFDLGAFSRSAYDDSTAQASPGPGRDGFHAQAPERRTPRNEAAVSRNSHSRKHGRAALPSDVANVGDGLTVGGFKPQSMGLAPGVVSARQLSCSSRPPKAGASSPHSKRFANTMAHW